MAPPEKPSHELLNKLIDAYFDSLQEEALPGIWSKGVAVARNRGVILEKREADGFVLRVPVAGKAVSPTVSIWPADEDAHCDCGDRVEPCIHVVAAVVALKNGWTQEAAAEQGALQRPSQAQLLYRLFEREGALGFERVILRPSSSPGGAMQEQVLTASLVSLMGGIDSGRIAAPPVPASRADFKVDQVFSQLQAEGLITQGVLARRGIPLLFETLKEIHSIVFEGKRVQVLSEPLRMRAILEDSPKGVRLLFQQGSEEGSSRLFSNGATFFQETFRPIVALPKVLLDAHGCEFGERDFPMLVSEILPVLEQDAALEVRAKKLPKLEKLKPRIVLETFRDPSRPEDLEVLPRLVYGRSQSEGTAGIIAEVIAEVIEGKMEILNPRAGVIPLRDEALEQSLIRELQAELHLKPRQRGRWSGAEAVEFLERSSRWERAGEAARGFSVAGELLPEISAGLDGARIRFSLGKNSAGNSAYADAERVVSAWRRGERQAPLLGGGWASIPETWLNQNVERLEALLAFKQGAPQRSAKLSTLDQLHLAELCSEAGGESSPELLALRERLAGFQGVPSAKLPEDLKADLRHYQRQGVDWLSYLRELGLGAILADDMGLGKTLQALCVIQGRTLIVAPTSVLPSWEEQIRRFRPGLRLGVYYGQNRRLEPQADVILTTYGLLRQDRALLTAETWDTAILDESQQIKNPDSQTARAAHELKAAFRVALTGTPIENRLDDLWSQIQFAQPGLLGSREEFKTRWGLGMIDGFKRKIKPIILRRMKKDVAPELPPKTETVLYCDLSDSERSAYRTVLEATREEVIRELEVGGSVFGALEVLLRLRQICAHPALVPGLGGKDAGFSSKLELLRETLEESLDLGHSVLIFSQWTSYLDWVERLLQSMQVEFLRLDGSTPDRGAVIERFQKSGGPRVMILSLKAGGVGLTLTKADHVIILDPWWNPAVEDQAADRAHRIGQTQPVLVQRLVARDTVEERILLLQKKKQELARQALGREEGGESGSMAGLELTREDLLALL